MAGQGQRILDRLFQLYCTNTTRPTFPITRGAKAAGVTIVAIDIRATGVPLSLTKSSGQDRSTMSGGGFHE